VHRGRIGVDVRSPKGGRAGAEIASVDPASPAALAGLAKGDVVVAVDGQTITSPAQLHTILNMLPAGTEIDLRFRRGEEARQARLRIEARQAAADPASTRNH
jgi:S1-C subfamily serine protease